MSPDSYSISFNLQLQQVRNKWANWHMLKDYKRRMLVKEHFTDRIRLITVKKNNILPDELRHEAAKEVHLNFPRDACFIRIRERCALTSRPRGTIKKFRLSRIMIRELIDYNKVSGMQRAMW